MDVVRRVWCNKFQGQLFITVPTNSGIFEGDFVKITKVFPPLIEGICQFKDCKKHYSDHTLKELFEHKLVNKKFIKKGF